MPSMRNVWIERRVESPQAMKNNLNHKVEVMMQELCIVCLHKGNAVQSCGGHAKYYARFCWTDDSEVLV